MYPIWTIKYPKASPLHFESIITTELQLADFSLKQFKSMKQLIHMIMMQNDNPRIKNMSNQEEETHVFFMLTTSSICFPFTHSVAEKKNIKLAELQYLEN